MTRWCMRSRIEVEFIKAVAMGTGFLEFSGFLLKRVELCNPKWLQSVSAINNDCIKVKYNTRGTIVTLKEELLFLLCTNKKR